jgi:anhydro-N-acetylmuramic acid kinase
MSGTSLDGLDIVCARLAKKSARWSFNIENAITLKYTKPWREKLSGAHLLSGEALAELDNEFGRYIGLSVNGFVSKNKIRSLDFIASHGHTVFHQPQRGFTTQIGNGNALHATTGVPVVCDFRSLDVQLGGQGAPLVPAGDHHLFGEYDVCLNLGGIANLSRRKSGKRVAFDICFANMGLNYLAGKNGKEFDEGGRLAATGKINPGLLKSLDQIYATQRKARPSLGREGFERYLIPLLNNESIGVADRMRTFCESIANEIALCTPSNTKIKLLATGGGVQNVFLISTLRSKFNSKVSFVIPDSKVVQFKEALVFALLGILKVRGEINVFKSATGATRDSSSGAMIGFK